MGNENQVLDKCPHCGSKLSPWQKVLLNVDREIMCKRCWYKIFLDTTKSNKQNKDSKEK